MAIPNYRVLLSYDADRKVFLARAPELTHCNGEGPTRADAIRALEEEIAAQIANMQAHGGNAPQPIDEQVLSGELTLKVTPALHRDLLWQARQEGVDLPHLVGEILAAGMEARRGSRGGRPSGNRAPSDHDNRGNERQGGDRGGRFGGRYNPNLMEDRANFIEYVRGLEHGGHGGQPGGGRGPMGGPGGGGGGPGGGNRRRRGGPGGGGGGGGGRGPGGGPGSAQGGGGGGGPRY